MDVEISYVQSVGKNAENKYDLRNKYKTKLDGLEKAYLKSKKSLEDIDKKIKK